MMTRLKSFFCCTLLVFLPAACLLAQHVSARTTKLFTHGWKFYLGDDNAAKNEDYNDSSWRNLNLPHDWSIELPFDESSPTGTGGGALRGGIGWYRKTFGLPSSDSSKKIFIDFDGVYMNSEVWINGHYLGLRPNGYISFRYELTPFLKFGKEKNVIAVRVDNSKQPNSRWYSGSGIYRNVWLVTVGKLFVDHWGTFIETPKVSARFASVIIHSSINNSSGADTGIILRNTIYDASGEPAFTKESPLHLPADSVKEGIQQFLIGLPHLWSTEDPYLYKVLTEVVADGKVLDQYTTSFGIRYFNFDADKGFSLNGKPVKIFGVCDHHDLGCLGTAVNSSALKRQLRLLKEMGINGIRTSHNPPAPELLDLADNMGFIVMDEAFDMWKRPKTTYDYHLYWDEWHKRDLEDQVLRDRNHPSVFIWSIGNEIPEQWAGKNGKDTSGRTIARELGAIVRSLDTARPITSALDKPDPNNEIYKSGALDLVGFNYHQATYKDFPELFPGKKFIATETTSALQTRGHYDMPSDSIRRWPIKWDEPFTQGNPDTTCSAYDNCSAPWGSTHEETLKEFLKYDFASGIFIWTGFDYIGEPTPYPWPARSSYFGIIDLAGFPKDVYYLYQSLCTDKTVLHVFPHWNWKKGDSVDVWAYYNHADEVELFLNGKSLGIKKKSGDDLHVMWRVQFEPGTIRAVSRMNGKVVLTREIKTAGKPAKILLGADRTRIRPDGDDLSFITAKVVDAAGNLVPDADNLIHFTATGEGAVIATDNGSETDLESFKTSVHKAFNGLCLAVLQSKEKPGVIRLTATAKGLLPATITVTVK